MTTRQPGRGFRPRLARDERGTSAVEFALVLPILILVYLACVELSHAITVDRKVTSAASAIGDLVAQGTMFITQPEMDNIFTAGEAILRPYSTSTMKVVVSSVKVTDDGDEVLSSCALHDTPLTKGSSIDIPEGVRVEGTTLIVTEIEYEYIPTLGQIFSESIPLSDTYYMRPRQVDEVELPC